MCSNYLLICGSDSDFLLAAEDNTELVSNNYRYILHEGQMLLLTGYVTFFFQQVFRFVNKYVISNFFMYNSFMNA